MRPNIKLCYIITYNLNLFNLKHVITLYLCIIHIDY